MPASDLTAMLNNPTMPTSGRRWVSLAILALLLIAGGGFAAYRYALSRGAASLAANDPARPPIASSLPVPTTSADLQAPGDAGLAVVAEDAAPHPITTSLPVQTSATLGVNTRPTGAKVFIDGEALEMLTPVRMQPITAGPHHIVIERTGYQPRELDVALHPGEHRVLDFELPEERPLDPSGSQAGSTPKKKASPSSRPGGSGFLTVKTVPWSRAYDGGRLLGETPLVSVPLIEGSHTITFVNPDLPPVKRKITVHVGEETKLSIKLDE